MKHLLVEIIKKEKALSEAINRLKEEKTNVYEKRIVASNIPLESFNRAINKLQNELRRQKKRRYNIVGYAKMKREHNLRTLNVGMKVYFKFDNVRHTGIIQKVCDKTFIVNTDQNEQWRINASLANPIRRNMDYPSLASVM